MTTDPLAALTLDLLDPRQPVEVSATDAAAIKAEVYAARALLADVRQVRAKVHTLLDSGRVDHGRAAAALRGIHTDLDTAVAAYTEATS